MADQLSFESSPQEENLLTQQMWGNTVIRHSFDIGERIKELTQLSSITKESRIPSLQVDGDNSFKAKSRRNSTDKFLASFIQDIDHTTHLTKEYKLYTRLKDCGYEALAKKLDSKKGEPWDQIKGLSSPILMEQLVDLFNVSLAKNPKNKGGINNILMNFGLSIAHRCIEQQSQEGTDQLLINDGVAILGKLIYLANKNPLSTSQAIHENQLNETISSINSLFKNEIAIITQRLEGHFRKHSNTPLQSADEALRTQIPIELAKALTTEAGTLNVGIIPLLLNQFLSNPSHPSDAEINISSTLKFFQRWPKWRGEFEKICPPKSSELPSNDIIRFTLGLDPTAHITTVQAKVTVLAALLSHLRQGHSRSCFATSLAINILSSHPDLCLKDFSHLIENGELLRDIKNNSIKFPFLMKMNCPALDKPISIDGEGAVICGNKKCGYIWDAPGVIAACQAIGFKNPKGPIQALLSKQNTPFPYQTSVKDLLLSLVRSLRKNKASSEVLYEKGRYAFGSQTTNALLPPLENVIANMAEGEESSTLKSASVIAAASTLREELDTLQDFPSNLKSHVADAFSNELMRRTTLQYDPSLVSFSLSKDLNCKKGGFVLYDRSTQKRIDDVDDYKTFLTHILADIKGTAKGSEKLADLLSMIISSDEFQSKISKKYQGFYGKMDGNMDNSHHEDSMSMPWKMLGGNDSKKVLEVYFESRESLKTEKIFPSSSEDLLTKIIDIAKTLTSNEKQEFLDNPHALVPIRIPGNHTFSLMPGHHTLAKGWNNKNDTTAWMETTVLVPGLKIAESQIDEKLRDAMIKYCLFELIPSDSSQQLLTAVSKIPPTASIQQFRNAILDICSQISPNSSDATNEQRRRQFDGILYKELPKSLKEPLEESAIVFADTNWSNGRDIAFCFVVNPGSGKMEIWQSNFDGSNMRPLNQKYWILNQEWEILLPNIPPIEVEAIKR